MMFDDPGHYSNVEWMKRSTISLSRPWWPQRCALTNKWLWIKPAMLVRRLLTGPGEPVVIDHWFEPKAYTLQSIKGWDINI